jgi:hypothetical protein
MLEDGAIEYEFYYRPGESHCHPALDRLAFLLEPAGVRMHWITDDRYDRTGLSADNAFDEPQYRRGGPMLPLKANAWNRVALNLQGDVVRLSLNGQLVYQRPLEPTNQRTFCVFHYADQTEARVRHIAWRGEWPRELPLLAQQELVGDNPAFLDEQRDSLAAAFEHDFASEGLPASKFSILFGTPDAFTPLPDGLHIDQRGGKGYRNATFAPLLKVEGDFDVIATYEQLVTEAAPDGSASLCLQGTLDNSQQTECGVLRRQTNDKVDADQQFYQTVVVTKEPAERRSYSRAMPVEAFAGKLRLARRGKNVYFLIAEGDSSLFRLVRTEQMTDDQIASGNLRLINQTKEAGRLRVVWKSLSIRAEKLSGLATEDPTAAVAELNRQRAGMPVRFAHDFTRERLTPDRFTPWGFSPATGPNAGGLRVSGPATDNWTSAGMTANLAPSGDFDAAFEFDLLKLTTPKAGLNSGVYLQIEIPNEQQHQYSVIFIGSPEGDRWVLAQSRERATNGALSYPSLGRAFVDQVQRLRLARRGSQLYFLYAEATSKPDRVLTRRELPTNSGLNTVIRMFVHTGGAGNTTETAWKKLAIHSN